MSFSISSLFISLLLASLLILTLHLLLTIKSNYKIFRIDFLQVFILIIFIRLTLPFEFINTHTIASTVILPKVYDISELRVMHSSITMTQAGLIIWLLGTLVMLLRLTNSLIRVHKFSHLLTPVPNNFLHESVQQLIPSNVTVSYLNKAESPFVLGLFKTRIVFSALPLSVGEQTYIAQHELYHIKNHDILKKYLVNLLVCVYWWFPPIYLFQKQVAIILEMEVDQQVVRNVNHDNYFNYVQSLVKITKKISYEATDKQNINNNLLPNFTIIESSTLKQRVQFLLTGYEIRYTNRLVKLLLVILPLLLTSIIFEPYRTNDNSLKGTKTIDQSSQTYIKHRYGKYYLYIDGKNIGSFNKLSDIDDPDMKKLPIINK